MRTNIVIDDTLMQKAMKISGLKTKREVVEKAIIEFVANRTRKDLKELRGKIEFADDYDYRSMRGRRQ
ncbi:MAG: type II toxin-antitoxin system VapB family antitoxin [Desulfotomaculaceae bacterium]|nr:type II toxin-antitoxin system VapB family antitoxin [Desulfotomaculaceae bacterium]